MFWLFRIAAGIGGGVVQALAVDQIVKRFRERFAGRVILWLAIGAILLLLVL